MFNTDWPTPRSSDAAILQLQIRMPSTGHQTMKTKTTSIPRMALIAALCLWAGNLDAESGQAVAPKQGKSGLTSKSLKYSGTLESVNAKDNSITLKRAFFKRTFNLGGSCNVIIDGKPHGDAGELRLGEWTTVAYQKVNAVPVASQVAQSLSSATGNILVVDAKAGTLKLDAGMMTRSFVLNEETLVRTRDHDKAKIDDLKPGERVTIAWARRSGKDVARRIDQTGATFSGRVEALDLTARTLRLKAMLSGKKFRLGGDCVVIVDRQKGSLDDIDVGRPATVSYEEADGVLIAYRISQEREQPVAGSKEPAGRDLVGATP
jgi:Cu/Ag efflux protein CusF